MGLFSFFSKQQTVQPKKGFPFSDEDRALSAEIRGRKRDIELLKYERESELHRLRLEREQLLLQQEIDDIRGADEETPSSNTTDDLMKLVLPLIIGASKGNTSPASVAVTSTPPQTGKQVFSTGQIQQIWDTLPRAVQKSAKKLDDYTLAGMIRGYMPNIAEESVADAVAFIKNS